MTSLHHNGRAGPWQRIIMLRTETDYKRGRVLFVLWQHYCRIIAHKEPHMHTFTHMLNFNRLTELLFQFFRQQIEGFLHQICLNFRVFATIVTP